MCVKSVSWNRLYFPIVFFSWVQTSHTKASTVWEIQINLRWTCFNVSVSFLPFSLSERSQAMFWWLWISLSTCHWRTCASFVGPNSMKSDMLWRYFLTTERMVTSDSGNLAWRIWQVSETCKCDGLVTRKKRACWLFAPMPSVTCILQIMKLPWEAGSCTLFERCIATSFPFWFTTVLFSVLIKRCAWKSDQKCIWNRNSCWKRR